LLYLLIVQPLYFEVAKSNFSLVLTGVHLLPWTMTIAFFAALTAAFVNNSMRARPAIWLGWFFTTFGVALMILTNRTSTPALWTSTAVLSGIGLGILYPTLSAVSQMMANCDAAGLPSAVTNHCFFQSLGNTIGVATGTCIFQNQLQKHLVRNNLLERLAKEYARDSIALIESIRKMPGGEGTLKTELGDAYVDALKTVWAFMAIVAGAAFVVSFFIGAVDVKHTVVGEGRKMKALDLERSVQE
jgi:hypothetical protein